MRTYVIVCAHVWCTYIFLIYKINCWNCWDKLAIMSFLTTCPPTSRISSAFICIAVTRILSHYTCFISTAANVLTGSSIFWKIRKWKHIFSLFLSRYIMYSKITILYIVNLIAKRFIYRYLLTVIRCRIRNKGNY